MNPSIMSCQRLKKSWGILCRHTKKRCNNSTF